MALNVRYTPSVLDQLSHAVDMPQLNYVWTVESIHIRLGGPLPNMFAAEARKPKMW